MAFATVSGIGGTVAAFKQTLNKGAFMYQDKKPAVWNLVNKNDNFTVYVSEGGGVKYCIINDQGNEQIVFTHAGRANENMALMVDFISESIGKVHDALSQGKKSRDEQKVQLKAQVEAQKALQNLQALGLTKEQILAKLAAS